MFLFGLLSIFFLFSSNAAASVDVNSMTSVRNISKFDVWLLQRMTERETEKLLRDLGIPNGPPSVNVMVPQYMDSLHELASSANATSCSNETESNSGACRDVEKALRVDTVASLTNRDYSEETEDFRQRLRFNTPSIVSKSDVSSAKLRVFRRVYETGSGKETFGSGSVTARVMAYLMTSNISGREKMLLLDTVDLFEAGGDQWVEFDVSNAAQEWVEHPQTQFVLELHTELLNKTRVKPSSVGLEKSSNNSETETILVVFHNGTEWDMESIRLKRSQLAVKQFFIDNSLSDLWYQTRKDMRRKDNVCQLRDFYIDFKLLKWSNIVRPRGYRAFICSGVCPFTLSNNMNATNHARVQNIMHHKYPDIYPPVACVPVKLSHLMVLYRDQNSDYKLIRMQDMIAVNCGCQ